MEIIEIMDPLNWYNQTHTVKLVDVKAFERNNKQVEGMNFIYVYMEDAVTFLKEKKKKIDLVEYVVLLSIKIFIIYFYRDSKENTPHRTQL